MIKTLLCKLNLGHHWLAEADQDGNFLRRCTNCGKYDRRGARRSGRTAAGGHPANSDIPEIPGGI